MTTRREAPSVGVVSGHLLNRIERRRSPRLESNLRPGAYVTDGRGLFRCISIDHVAPAETTVLLEDCMSLDVALWTMAELITVDLRVVRA